MFNVTQEEASARFGLIAAAAHRDGSGQRWRDARLRDSTGRHVVEGAEPLKGLRASRRFARVAPEYRTAAALESSRPPNGGWTKPTSSPECSVEWRTHDLFRPYL